VGGGKEKSSLSPKTHPAANAWLVGWLAGWLEELRARPFIVDWKSFASPGGGNGDGDASDNRRRHHCRRQNPSLIRQGPPFLLEDTGMKGEVKI